MIARLRGRLVALDAGAMVVDVAGVGYRVLVPAGAFAQRLGDEVVVHTHLAVREDALTLFGFPDVVALRLFERLLGVNGIGPKLALAAISALGADGVREAIVTEDTKALVGVPGLGRKTAQRLILELGGTLVEHSPAAATAGAAPAGEDPRADVRLALASLGYEPSEITRALQRVDEHAGGDRDALLRKALQALAGA
ncbi:MAG TPA: Holliday junction branch migration protein RuvA [Euzebyales bacterium]|nr:Holliday junction branch migration protein RuvA [Euzebyales bacterium]